MLGVYLNFGGFYESIHSGLIECTVEQMYEDDEGNFDQDGFDSYDWKVAFDQYAEQYVENLSLWLESEMGVSFRMEFKSVVSPRFYNFSTDKIEVHISVEDAKKLRKWMIIEHPVYINQIALAITTARDGYVPFRTYDEVMDDAQLLTEVCLDLACDLYNDEELIDGIHSMVPLEFLM